MKLINHQFINEPFFLPDWEVKHLLIGTFNPDLVIISLIFIDL